MDLTSGVGRRQVLAAIATEGGRRRGGNDGARRPIYIDGKWLRPRATVNPVTVCYHGADLPIIIVVVVVVVGSDRSDVAVDRCKRDQLLHRKRS